MAANGDGNKLVWITEFGAFTPTDAASEQLQANLMIAAYAKQKALSWLGPLFWYEYQDGRDFATKTKDNLYGIVATDGTHKPAFATYTALAHQQPVPPPSGNPTSANPPPISGSTNTSKSTTGSTGNKTQGNSQSSTPSSADSNANPNQTNGLDASTDSNPDSSGTNIMHRWLVRVLWVAVVWLGIIAVWWFKLIPKLRKLLWRQK